MGLHKTRGFLTQVELPIQTKQIAQGVSFLHLLPYNYINNYKIENQSDVY